MLIALSLVPVSPALAQAPAGAPAAAPSSVGPLGPVGDTTTTNTSRQTQNPNSRTRAAREEADVNNNVPAGSQDRITEFQQLVEGTTGRPVQIFGANLFQQVPSTFAPVDNVPVNPDYVLGPGDEVRVQVYGQVNQQNTFTVDRSGNISFPQLGAVHVAGIKYSDLNEYLRSQLARVYRNFELNVNLGQLRSIQVFVVGQARRPGSYTVGSLSTLLNALFASGGPLPTGSLRDIQVRRGSAVVARFDLYDLLLRGDKTKDIALASGDVIFIPPVRSQVAVVGSVNTPAIYEVLNETTVDQVLALAGGETSVATEAQVRLERIFNHADRSVLDVSLASAATLPVQNGDIISVASIIDRFKDAVTLRGNVANPGRYVWHPGMHVSDLIPNKEALITRNYWRKRNQLGQLSQDYTPEAAQVLNSANDSQNGNHGSETAPSGNAEGSLQLQGGGTNPASTNAPRGGNGNDNGGSSVGVALTTQSTIFNAKTDVILSAPDINWSYAVIERLSTQDLTTSLLPFSLGGIVLNGDQSQNLELLPGDVITIFSKADLRVPSQQQTRFVRLEGEFNASGVYSVRPGETLRQLLVRAGGFTPDAYLYASEFTRESTRRVEQQRLREYADQLEAQVSAVTSGLQVRALNDRDASAAVASASDARAAIARLRSIEPIGRIVLNLSPNSSGVNALPDLALEDGDRFVVPRVPSNVTVEGQVYSANAFVYEPGRNVLDYIHLAGGPDRQADRKRAFVLRADGSVLSRQYGKFDRLIMYPGDAIVVPPQLDKRAFLRNLVDVASIVGNLGFTFAAIDLYAR